MRWLFVAGAVLGACDAGAPPAPEPAPVPVPIVEKAPPLYELIRDVPGTKVTVSSTVKNRHIVPMHLIDRDMNTAWSSRTNDLAGAWIEVTAPPGGRIHELRLTVGHTGTGPRGEDYFTMNPRIAKVLVDEDDVDHVYFLDSTSRALQTIRVDTTRVRLTIAELRPGTKRDWREVAISELEALGTIERRTGEKIVPAVKVADDLCARVPKRDPADCTSGCTEGHCVPDGLPDCFARPVDVDGGKPWAVPTVACEIADNARGPTSCSITLETAGGIVLAAPPHETRTYPSPPTARLEDIVAGGPPELVIRYEDQREGHAVVVCRAEPLACTAPEPATTARTHPPVF